MKAHFFSHQSPLFFPQKCQLFQFTKRTETEQNSKSVRCWRHERISASRTEHLLNWLFKNYSQYRTVALNYLNITAKTAAVQSAISNNIIFCRTKLRIIPLRECSDDSPSEFNPYRSQIIQYIPWPAANRYERPFRNGPRYTLTPVKVARSSLSVVQVLSNSSSLPRVKLTFDPYR